MRPARNARTPAVVFAALALLIVISAIVYLQTTPQSQTPPTLPSTPPTSPNLLLGNPSGATSDPANQNNYLMVKPYFALSYNNSSGTPNWVSWRLTTSDLGTAPRKQIFDLDTTLPPGLYRVTHKDYSASGFDRGHLCPHGDRAASQEMSFSTFVMTNIIPQAPHVNQKAWAHQESWCRDLVRRQHHHLYIIAGPSGKGGRGSAGLRDVIAGGKVTVPARCWKVVVIVPEAGGGNDLARISASTRVVTVIMPNDNDMVGDDWAQFRTTPAEVERQNGLRFFDTLSPDVAQALRQKLDTAPIASPRTLGRSGG
jgi:endonuclease G